MAKQIPNNHFFFHVIFDFVKIIIIIAKLRKLAEKKEKKHLCKPELRFYFLIFAVFLTLKLFSSSIN
jgi:small neutral amino acid transporter SnatA (MarC family)